MILDRMTTLIQKSKALRQLKSQLENRIGQTLNLDYKSQLSLIKKELEERGIYWRPADLAALLEEVSPEASRVALGYALDYLRPFSTGMGLRIARLSESQIEIVIPSRLRNRTDDGVLHEAALLPAAIEALKIFWQRQIDETIQIRLLKESTQWHQTTSGAARLKMEISGQQRELILSQLRESTRQTVEMNFQVYDETDKLLAEIDLHALIQKVARLT